jgi:hypothetical protein
MATKANLLGRILEASTDIYAFLPEDASSPHFTKDITKGTPWTRVRLKRMIPILLLLAVYI